MGVDFIIIFENLSGKKKKEIEKEFESLKGFNDWACFSFEKKKYVSWLCAPRYFWPEDHPEIWESLRKFLVRVRNFLGGGKIYLGNDVIDYCTPSDTPKRWKFHFPFLVEEEWLKEPKDPDLVKIKELEKVHW